MKNISEYQLKKLKRYDKAQYHTNRLIEYLLENASSYPLYDNPGSGFDTIVPQLYAYDEGIFLGRNPKYISYEEIFEKRKRF